MRSPVVIGVGNPYRHDDAVGLEVARGLAAVAPPGVRVLEHDGEPAGLIDLWSDAEVAYVVDAVHGAGSPGKIHRLEVGPEGLPAVPRRDSSHALGLGDAVALGRAVGRMPGRLVVVGVEGERFDAGEGLTTSVAEAAGAVVRSLAEELSSPERTRRR